MSQTYANHPFPLLSTPAYQAKQNGELPENQKLDMFTEVASEMVLVHNMIIGGLNCIYLQASHIKPTVPRNYSPSPQPCDITALQYFTSGFLPRRFSSSVTCN
ncbi:uncharacterized protein CTHT_0020860 [Thermochaetoides thermophila DSM 1495]|uniref:Uncharacterized protein n=1 Tax=Chaetomium thermophilum (strain DSM 1495 / CBS 144.50 / IMI 039719) TaxID=759272 RepID=G0S3F8_CHATD|nr:hypothetical protein CTHT_0020860 [Thermochaetoides thermophila DSM 1495]EGS22541.1 hypothetical protein CTHT_0020860 [Thermochaetoides thermophila DSM 1495]